MSMKVTNKVLSGLVAIALIPLAASAATFGGGETYNLKGDAIIDDNLYVAAGDITIAGTVQGDLQSAGGVIVFTGSVQDDIALAGGNITVLGSVGGDARVAGGSILIDTPITGDLLAAGGVVKVLDGVTVGKDVSMAGGLLMLSGSIQGDAKLAGGEILLDGFIAGDVVVEVGEKLTLGEDARISGNLVYRASREDVLNIHEQAIVSGNVSFEKSKFGSMAEKEAAQGIAVLFGLFYLIKVASIAIAAVVLVLLFKRFSVTLTKTVLESFWMSMLKGFVYLVMLPVTALLLMITVLGLHLGLLLLALYGLTLIVACIYSGVVFGVFMMDLISKDNHHHLTWWHALLGVVSLSILNLVPYLGWLLVFAFMLATLGALFQMAKVRFWNHR